MTIGAQDGLRLRDTYMKAGVADHEVKAASNLRGRDVQGALMDASAARKVRYQAIVGIAMLICIGLLTYWFFFHALD